jgi:hypothetical protein
VDKNLFKQGVSRGWLVPAPSNVRPARYWILVAALSAAILAVIEILSWLRVEG